jgi:hypothetical protein
VFFDNFGNARRDSASFAFDTAHRLYRKDILRALSLALSTFTVFGSEVSPHGIFAVYTDRRIFLCGNIIPLHIGSIFQKA